MPYRQPGGVLLGDNCNLSSEVRIWTGQHSVQLASFDYEKTPVIIGRRFWISSNVIFARSYCWRWCCYCRRSSCNKNVEPYSIVAGVPAKRIGERNRNINYSFNGSHDWFI